MLRHWMQAFAKDSAAATRWCPPFTQQYVAIDSNSNQGPLVCGCVDSAIVHSKSPHTYTNRYDCYDQPTPVNCSQTQGGMVLDPTQSSTCPPGPPAEPYGAFQHAKVCTYISARFASPCYVVPAVRPSLKCELQMIFTTTPTAAVCNRPTPN